MHTHTVKVKGNRYFVFNEDYYNSSGGMFDCQLITNDYEEAKSLVIKLSKQEYFPSSVGLLDLKNKTYHSYVDGKIQKESEDFIKIIWREEEKHER